MSQRILLALMLLGLMAFGGGCRSASSAFWGALGYEKRDLLVSDVKEARDEQNKAKEEIKTALQRFKEVTAFEGGELESKYKKLQSAYDDAESRAAKVTKRIDDVEYSAGQLFSEWEKEIGQYSDPALRSRSEKNLAATKSKYRQLLEAMRNAESKMKPVLQTFKDHVLALKHELNASAIASLQGEVVRIEEDVTALIADMEKSINEANAFVAEMDKK